jgi:hypothetical protein
MYREYTKYLAFVIAITAAFELVYAYNPYENPKTHLGAICIDCHKRFKDVIDNPTVSSFRPCYKDDCHLSADKWGGKSKRESLHLSREICKNCHTEIHTTHRDRVNCRVCHMSPRGWNSSKVRIPVSKEQRVFEEMTITIPGSAECSYCHFKIPSAKNIHEVHSPELKNNQTCLKCHGKVIEKRPDLIAKMSGEKIEEKKRGLMNSRPIVEFIRFYNLITMQLIELFTSKVR